MAHFAKVDSLNWNKVLDHDLRKHTDGRDHIDKTLSEQNYDLVNRESPHEFVKKKIEESKKSGGRFQKGTVILCECIITLPEDFQGDEKLFFKECKKVLDSHFGADNCVTAIVHKDEPTARPHLHYKAVPLIEKTKTNKKGETKTIKQFSAKELLDKVYLSYFHDKLQAELDSVFKCPVNVLTGGSTKTMKEEIVELKEKINVKNKIIREQKAIIKEQEEKIKEQNKFISAAKSLIINGRSVFQMIMEHMRKSLLRRKVESSSVINKEKEIDIEL